MEFGLSSNPDKSILKLDPRTKLCLLTAISLIMVGGKTVGVEYILRIICAAIPFVCPPRKNRQKTYAKNRMKRMTNII